MTASRSPEWAKENRAMDILAILTSLEDRAGVIILQAWNEANWNAVFEEAIEMQDELRALHNVIQRLWSQLYQEARQA